jgi:hypothetical protein
MRLCAAIVNALRTMRCDLKKGDSPHRKIPSFLFLI